MISTVSGQLRFNWSIDADRQQQDAASPQVLMRWLFLRWAS